jgi:hypothetical protein
LRRNITGNGTDQVFWWCEACQRTTPPGFLSHEAVRSYLSQYGKTLEDLPILHNYSADAPRCAICGAVGAEYNHYMPRTFYRDPDITPEWAAWEQQGAYLCRHHHMIWHRLVTPHIKTG